MFESSPILLPVFCLVIWTIIQLFWMAATRLPAIAKADLEPTAGQRTSELGKLLPENVQWKADNYNHLLEQPTIFYACAIALALIGEGAGLNLMLAWGYVGLRVIHSIVQSTTNVVLLRFGLFILSTILLLVMAVNGALDFMG